jgi:hypothetical protein
MGCLRFLKRPIYLSLFKGVIESLDFGVKFYPLSFLKSHLKNFSITFKEVQNVLGRRKDDIFRDVNEAKLPVSSLGLGPIRLG